MTVPGEHLELSLGAAEGCRVAASEAGTVGGDRLVVRADGTGFDLAVEELYAAWHLALPRALDL